MNRLYAILFAVTVSGVAVVGACGGKTFGSICDQIPAPVACMQACDPQPGAANTCPAGYHCNPDGTCDAQCTAGGGQCGDGYTCDSNGNCVGDGSGSAAPDANCPAVHFTPMATTPSIELVLDRSGSMTTNFGGVSRYQALHDGLFGVNGAVTTTQASVYFGEELFAGDQTPCTDGPPGTLFVTGYSAPRALNNATVLDTLTTGKPPNNGATPTAPAIDTAVADFNANPPPAGSPPIILLATDGAPNSCGGGGGSGPSITAVTNAYNNAGAAHSIRTFVIGLAGLNTAFLQSVANAGTGTTVGNAPYYTANDPASLAAGFAAIINGVLSCDLTITGQVDPATASSGSVTLNGMNLTYGTDWTVDPNGMVIHLIGTACTTLKNTASPTVDASFPCGSVIF